MKLKIKKKGEKQKNKKKTNRKKIYKTENKRTNFLSKLKLTPTTFGFN